MNQGIQIKEIDMSKGIDFKSAMKARPRKPASQIQAWHIGESGEVFAGYSVREVKEWYIKNCVGPKDDPKEHFDSGFSEISKSEMDDPFKFDDGEGGEITTTWRKLAAREIGLPAQISTTYN